jgi:hypothetical protein
MTMPKTFLCCWPPVSVLVYSGEDDFICNWKGSAAWTSQLQWPGHDAFNAAPNTTWHVNGVAAGFRSADGLTFRVTTTLPQGTTPSLTMKWLLSNGAAGEGFLSVQSSSVVAIGSQLTNTAGLTVGSSGSVSGAVVTFAFGQVQANPPATGPGAYVAGNVQITLEVVALVTTVAGNGNRTALSATATLDNSLVQYASYSNTTIVEPNLSVAISANATNVEAGSVVAYTATVAHVFSGLIISKAPAYNVMVNVSFPADLHLVLQTGSVRASKRRRHCRRQQCGQSVHYFGIVRFQYDRRACRPVVRGRCDGRHCAD